MVKWVRDTMQAQTIYSVAKNTPLPQSSTTVIKGDIEPELCGIVPRRVVYTPYITRYRVRCLNVLAIFLTLNYHFWRLGGWDAISMSCFVTGVFLIILCAMWANAEYTVRRSYFLLQRGLAVRATVVQLRDAVVVADGEVNLPLYFSYTYPKGITRGGFTTVTHAEKIQIGPLKVGSTFTILVNPSEMYDTPLPYFQIKGAEIPGAAPARSAPV